MRNNSARFSLTLLLITPLLAGCLEQGRPTVVNANGDDAACRAQYAVGSPDYVACRKDRDVARSNAQAKVDGRQRRLGEYMLNHPETPGAR